MSARYVAPIRIRDGRNSAKVSAHLPVAVTRNPPLLRISVKTANAYLLKCYQ
jgi:hypothetical protein